MVNLKVEKQRKIIKTNSAKVKLRDNSTAYELRGVPMHSCTACGKKYQTKAQCIMHIKKVHESG